jgi:integrase
LDFGLVLSFPERFLPIMARIIKPLSDRQCMLAKPGAAAITLFDGGGLCLEVSPKGLKSWRLIYLQPASGKKSRLTLGHYPEITLSAAREKRAEVRALLDAGKDPAAPQEAPQPVSVDSFESVAREWHRTVYAVNEVGERTAAQNLHRLEENVFPALGRLLISAIEPMTILGIIRVVEQRGAIAMAQRIRGLIVKVFDYAIVTGKLKTGNPASALKSVVQAYEPGHFAAIRVAELPDLIKAMRKWEPVAAPQSRALMRIMMLSLCRTDELISTPWSEIDLERSRWVIPWQRMKMGQRKKKPRKVDHHIFLPPDAWTMLRQLNEWTGHQEYVFSSSRGSPGKTVSNNLILAALGSMGYQNRMTGHGFRSLGKGVLKLLGYDDGGGIVKGLIERALAHKSKEAHGAAYDRELFLAERRAMMLDYAGYLAAVERGDKQYRGAVKTVDIGVDPLDYDPLGDDTGDV